ncbi:cell division ATP-binding protein FtsE [Carboxydothermus islandicus]|nr:cell division ATP-binding protein FtsE [Carboxydothermus islandicus]
MLQLFNVTKIYPGSIKALSDVSFKVNKGEFVFLVGNSGAGKSTLLKLITREELPTHGQILVNGKNIVRLRGREIPLYRRRIGMVFQDFRLLPNKTAFENVAFALEICGLSGKQIKERSLYALERVGMAKKADRFPAELSGGEAQRVAIARAIVNNPILLLADEPTGNLDPENSLAIINLLKEINYSGTTVIVATHDALIVDALRQRVIALKDGKIVRDEESGAYAG